MSCRWNGSRTASVSTTPTRCSRPTTRLIELSYKTWQYHFEFLNLGYAAYLDFFGFVKSQFPTIPDQAIAKMVQGVDSELFRPDDEIKKLARLAVELGVDGALMTGTVDAGAGRRGQGSQRRQVAGRLGSGARTRGSTSPPATGSIPTDKYWIDHLDIPMGYLRDYIPRVKAGEHIERPTATPAWPSVTGSPPNTASMMDEEAQAVFDGKLGLSRTVFPYVEDHNFYIEHWALGVFWRKMRELVEDAVRSRASGPTKTACSTSTATRCATSLWDYGAAWAIGDAERRFRHLARRGGPPPQAGRGPCQPAAAPRAEQPARGHHRALHHHALGHHLGRDRPLDRLGRRQRRPQGHGRLSGCCRRHRPRPAQPRPAGRVAEGRDSGDARHRAVLGARCSARSPPPSPTSAA